MHTFAKKIRRLSECWTAVLGCATLTVVCGTFAPAAESAGDSAVQRLGRLLFFDESLSADGKVSCAACHQPEREFSDGRSVSVGVYGKTGTRNAPSLTARRVGDPVLWDGRRPTLEAQVLEPMVSPFEHGLPSIDGLISQLRSVETYGASFNAAFPHSLDKISVANITHALAEYINSIPTDATRVERFLSGDRAALSENEKHGLQIFRGRAQCAQCHLVDGDVAAVSDGRFHSVGIGLSHDVTIAAVVLRGLEIIERDGLDNAIFADAEVSQLGRFLVTKDPRDIGKFKTPGLRRVSRTSPYMHDGSVATLEEALDRELYYRSLANGVPIALTPDERSDLLAFLRAL